MDSLAPDRSHTDRFAQEMSSSNSFINVVNLRNLLKSLKLVILLYIAS